MKSKRTKIIAEIRGATGSAYRLRILYKPTFKAKEVTTWIGKSQIILDKQLAMIDGDQYVLFDCPEWILKNNNVNTSWLKEVYSNKQLSTLKQWLTVVNEIIINKIPTLERKGKIDANYTRLIQDDLKVLQTELSHGFPTENFRDIMTVYNHAVIAYRRLVSKAIPVKPKVQPSTNLQSSYNRSPKL